MRQLDNTLTYRITVLNWLLPLLLSGLAIFYQLIVAHWVFLNYGEQLHFGLEILLYGILEPIIMFWALTHISRWLGEKAQIEKQARENEQQLISIMSASADAIITLDSNWHIESWNRGAELLFGYFENEMHGHRFTDLFRSSEAAEVEFAWLINNLQQAGFMRGYETTCLNAEGESIIVELTATNLVDEDGKTQGMSVILRDITDRKHREEEIRLLNTSLNEQVAERTRTLAEKVEELRWANAELKKLDQMRTEFVSLVSHQLRAPLTNMSGAVEHIQANCRGMNTTCNRMVPILIQQFDRLDRLVRDVLNTARIETGEFALLREPISLASFITPVVNQIRTRKADRPIRVHEKPGLPLVLADRDRVEEVLANLLDNADKYSPPGEEIIIDTSANDVEVTLSVRDTGPGLPDDTLEHIFEKFYRIDNSDSQAVYGYGLGLYICKRLIEAQGGCIWAENAAGSGAVFSFTLPVANLA